MPQSPKILIVARTGCFGWDKGKYASAELYATNFEDVAARFIELWAEKEEGSAEASGGYPGEAYVILQPLSAAEWVEDQEKHLEEMLDIGPNA